MPVNTLLERFKTIGLPALADDAHIVEELEAKAVSSGKASFLFLAETVRSIRGLHDVEDKYGGVQAQFIQKVETLTSERLGSILSGDATVARAYRNEIQEMVAGYRAPN